jgi:hypothetical protein
MDVDKNGLVDIFVQTWLAGVVRYEIAGSLNHRILWGVGKGDYARSTVAPASARNGTRHPTNLGKSGTVSTTASTTTPAGSAPSSSLWWISLIVIGILLLAGGAILAVILIRRHGANAGVTPSTGPAYTSMK